MAQELTKHFTLAEAGCRDGTALPEKYIDNALKVAGEMEVIRQALGNEPIHVISWYRTPKYNKKVRGSRYSQHLKAKAMDIVHHSLTPDEVYEALNNMMEMGEIIPGGIGRYNTFTHYDCRGKKARWDERTKK